MCDRHHNSSFINQIPPMNSFTGILRVLRFVAVSKPARAK